MPLPKPGLGFDMLPASVFVGLAHGSDQCLLCVFFACFTGGSLELMKCAEDNGRGRRLMVSSGRFGLTRFVCRTRHDHLGGESNSCHLVKLGSLREA